MVRRVKDMEIVGERRTTAGTMNSCRLIRLTSDQLLMWIFIADWCSREQLHR